MQMTLRRSQAAVLALCAFLSAHSAPTSAQAASSFVEDPSSFVEDLITAGVFASVERASDSVVATAGPKFRLIGAPQARAELCQRLLVHVRSSDADVSRIALHSSEGGVIGSCTASGYQAGG